MGAVDVIMKEYARVLFVPVVIAGLLVYKRRRLLTMLSYIYKVSYAWVLARVAKSYNKKLDKRKTTLFTELHDMKINSKQQPFRILEIGAGSGANFKYYPEGVHVVCIDPNPYFEDYLKGNASSFPHVVLDQFVVCGAENMSTVPSESIDAVVCTLVLCTVEDIVLTLSEIKRVLKKGGKFFYMEHVAAKDGTFLYKAQNFINPLWKIIGDNCHLNKQTGKMIDKAGFTEITHTHFRAPFRMPLIAPHLAGIATK